MKKQPLKIQQLIKAIRAMTELQFITPQDKEGYKVTPLGIKKFDIHTDGLQNFKTVYMSEMDENEVHIYSTEGNHQVFIFESRAFYKNFNFDDTVYMYIVDLMTVEYVSTRRDLEKILGTPSYQHDEFWEFAVDNRHVESKYAKRRDIALEWQMIHNAGELKLTYWLQHNQVIYLTLGHVDKEESVTLVLGVRPNRIPK